MRPNLVETPECISVTTWFSGSLWILPVYKICYNSWMGSYSSEYQQNKLQHDSIGQKSNGRKMSKNTSWAVWDLEDPQKKCWVCVNFQRRTPDPLSIYSGALTWFDPTAATCSSCSNRLFSRSRRLLSFLSHGSEPGSESTLVAYVPGLCCRLRLTWQNLHLCQTPRPSISSKRWSPLKSRGAIQ